MYGAIAASGGVHGTDVVVYVGVPVVEVAMAVATVGGSD